MPKVVFIGSDGEKQDLDIPVGNTMMEAALDNSVAGIVAECGGACACATCHVYVAAEWAAKIPGISEMEDALLDAAQSRQSIAALLVKLK